MREVSPAGVVTTIAGVSGNASTCVIDPSGGPSSAPQGFCRLNGLAVDAHGNVFVSDAGGHAIRKVSAGVVTTLYGGFANLPAPNMMAIAVDGSLVIDSFSVTGRSSSG
ncbi:MAG: hypothetical protein ABW032_12550 [Burkholderiaceae bacterium]